MKILSAAQIREADAYTIREKKIESVELMERAAKAFAAWFQNKYGPGQPVKVFCGPGNNGGDGLAVARLLAEAHYSVAVFAVGDPDKRSRDFSLNLERLPEDVPVQEVKTENDLPPLSPDYLVIDGLFGTGLSRKAEGLFAAVIRHLNASGAPITAIDLPSGLFTDTPTPTDSPVVQARYTVGFELPKLAYLLPQNVEYVGEWHLVPIGLSQAFIQKAETNSYYVTAEKVSGLLKPRQRFTHKGTYGHALLIGGSYGKMGAITLSARACLRSGVGLLTVYIPEAGYPILQTAVPEAMTLTDPHSSHVTHLPDLGSYQAIGIGPGLGKHAETKEAVAHLLRDTKAPLVIDADGINLLAENQDLLAHLPPRLHLHATSQGI